MYMIVAMGIVDNDKIVVLDDITCDRHGVSGVIVMICMTLLIFTFAYMAITSMSNTFKIENLLPWGLTIIPA